MFYIDKSSVLIRSLFIQVVIYSTSACALTRFLDISATDGHDRNYLLNMENMALLKLCKESLNNKPGYF